MCVCVCAWEIALVYAHSDLNSTPRCLDCFGWCRIFISCVISDNYCQYYVTSNGCLISMVTRPHSQFGFESWVAGCHFWVIPWSRWRRRGIWGVKVKRCGSIALSVYHSRFPTQLCLSTNINITLLSTFNDIPVNNISNVGAMVMYRGQGVETGEGVLMIKLIASF